MTTQRLTLLRLEKQEKSLDKQPIPNMLVKRKGVLNFHFCVHGLEGPYSGGFYHGVLQLPHDYPFSPPQLKFLTESGRFETNKPICTTFTNYHKEQWTSAWNVRTMLLAVVSFMNSSEGGNGSIRSFDSVKREHAKKSLSRNLQSKQFRQLFYQKLVALRLHTQSSMNENIPNEQSSNSEQIKEDNKIYILVLILMIVVAIYGILKNNQSVIRNSNEF